jgi:hypothetical protein
MAGDSVIGADWSSAELDAIVADYFVMLREEQAGHSYNKTAHRRELMEDIRRTKGSIEFKHQNISAVLTQLGLPRISGYLPAWNFQSAIADAIGRFLEKNPNPIPLVLPQPAGFSDTSILFEESAPLAPPLRANAKEAFERVARKFDAALRDQLNRQLGHAGEKHVFESERRRLEQVDRSDLARKVRWVSEEDGDGAGYDIRSFSPAGEERLLEVKTTRGGNTTPFYLTRNENDFAKERPDAFRLYRLYDFSKKPRLFTLTPPLEAILRLESMTYRASLK